MGFSPHTHMRSSASRPGAAVVAAMFCAGTVTAQFIAGKATRDALYLANLDVTSLPAMVIATAVLSMGLVLVSARGLRALSPATFFSLAFAASALLLVAEWALVSVAPRIAAAVVYLQISGIGPMLGSGFWLIASERLDPHTAKKRFGQIAGAGTLGGLVGGLLAGLVLLGTIGAALMDYLFKAEAVATFGRGDGLLRFFAIYYAATSLLTFV